MGISGRAQGLPLLSCWMLAVQARIAHPAGLREPSCALCTFQRRGAGSPCGGTAVRPQLGRDAAGPLAPQLFLLSSPSSALVCALGL